MTEHWFDRLSQDVLRSTSRRQAVGLAALLATVVTHGTLEAEAGKKKQRKQKGKGKKGTNKRTGKGSGQKRPDHLGPPNGVDDCQEFLDPVLWNDCREIRRTCHAPDQFCIHAVDNPAGEDGEGAACCSGPKTCCIDGCQDTRTDRYNCGGCGVVCPPGKRCTGGVCDCEEGYQYCADAGFCIPAENTCCGMLEYEGCHPTLPCCGAGINAYCGRFGYCP